MIVEWALPDDLTAAREARVLVSEDLGRRGIPDGIADDVVLIASELAANAVRHGQPPVTLRLEFDADRVRVVVGNHGSMADPHITAAGEEQGHGRGLAMVESLASDVGWSREGDRLDVWADVSLAGPAPH